jgi:hypothetical protein
MPVVYRVRNRVYIHASFIRSSQDLTAEMPFATCHCTFVASLDKEVPLLTLTRW